MKNWTIKKRIIAGFAVILTLIGILTVASYVLLRQIRAEAMFMNTDALPGLTAMAKISGTVSEIQIKVLRTIIAKTPEERKKNEDEVAAMRADILKVMDDYDKSIHLAEDREMFKTLAEAREDYVHKRGQLFDLINAGKTEEAIEFNVTTLRPTYVVYQKTVDKMMDWNIANATRSSANSEKVTNRVGFIISGLSALVIILGVVLATVLVVGLNRILSHVAASLAEGSNQVATAAGQVSSSSQSLAEGSSEQAASIEETSASLEELSSMTRRNAENAQKANDLAKQARAAADKGSADMQSMASAMEAIKTSSDDIAKIIKTIDEIAFQTNILALNAAVEAARAGEAGMGFAVVADEVRNLAQRSANAAKETAAKIEGAINNTTQGVELTAKVVETLNDIVGKARQVDELVAEVASASKEQTQGISQINGAVGQMDKVTQSNAANAEESAAAAEELNAQAATMKDSVNELLQLVGGAGHEAKPMTASPAPAVRPKSSSNPRASGNGHAPAPALSANGNSRRSEIPMEADFKDF